MWIFTLKYLPAKLNCLEDSLSRKPLMQKISKEEDWNEVDSQVSSLTHCHPDKENDPVLQDFIPKLEMTPYTWRC